MLVGSMTGSGDCDVMCDLKGIVDSDWYEYEDDGICEHGSVAEHWSCSMRIAPLPTSAQYGSPWASAVLGAYSCGYIA